MTSSTVRTWNNDGNNYGNYRTRRGRPRAFGHRRRPNWRLTYFTRTPDDAARSLFFRFRDFRTDHTVCVIFSRPTFGNYAAVERGRRARSPRFRFFPRGKGRQLYARTVPARITIFNCSGSNSLTIVVTCLSFFWVCNNLLPSWVMSDFTLRPSAVSSSNSSPSLNAIDVFLNVEFDDRTYLSSFLVSSTTGVTEFPNLRVSMPTPAKKPHGGRYLSDDNDGVTPLGEIRGTLVGRPFRLSRW